MAGLPATLRESDHSLRLVMASWVRAAEKFRRVSGYKDLWMLTTALYREAVKNGMEEGKPCVSRVAYNCTAN